LIESDPKVALFFAAEFASGMPERESSLAHSVTLRKAFSNNPCKPVLVENDTLEIHPTPNVVTCSPDMTIQQAAKLMAERNVGSIIISNEQKHPLGIITDTDLRKKVVAIDANVKTQPVTSIMSSPVYTVEKGQTVADLIILMMKTNLRHFCVTLDGTPHSPIEGIISEHDVVTAEGNNPAVIIKEIMQCREKEKLAIASEKAEALLVSYLQQEVGIHFIANVITEINDAMIISAMQFALDEMKADGYEQPNLRFCWLSMGSEGRKEQLLRTDQDNAILYENPPASESEKVAGYFLKLGEKVTQILIESGFKKCPADIMASNPQWNLSLKGWQTIFEKWILTPDPKAVMHSTIFFDFRPVYGNTELADELKSFILEKVKNGRGFLTFFAQNALQNPPPLSFFRNFIVESSGKHANEFDIKARTMMPLCDAARVLAFELGVKEYLSTFERFEKISEIEPQLKDLAKESGMAYEILMRLRAQNGLKNQNSGRYINPNNLNKLERQALRNIFKTIESLQSTINLRYQLDYLRG
jgi:CBS domain-containing protein